MGLLVQFCWRHLVYAPGVTHHLLQDMARYAESKFALVVENLAPATRAADVRYEGEYFGPVRRCERDRELRVCLIEFDRCASVRSLQMLGHY